VLLKCQQVAINCVLQWASILYVCGLFLCGFPFITRLQLVSDMAGVQQDVDVGDG